MKSVVILLALVASTLGNHFEGKFRTKDGSMCEWEERVYEGKERALGIECDCLDMNGSQLHYSCEYHGNPFTCAIFDKQGAPERFYRQLVEFIQNEKHACDLPVIHAGEATRVCKGADVDLTKQETGRGIEHDSDKCRKKRDREL